MRCDDAQALVSAALDHGPEPGKAVDAHVRTCRQCRAFVEESARVRRHLRYELVETVPNVAPRVRSAVAAPRRRPVWLAPAAALLVGVVVGASFIGLTVDRDPDTAAADLSADVLAAQRDLRALVAGVEVVEHGWHGAVPTRTYHGELAYRAPESLALTLTDETAYPSAAWVPNDVTVVVAEDESWTTGPAGCPRELLPGCTPPEPRVRAVTAREPFPDATPAPLDLVVPVGSFAGSAETPVLDTGERAGRAAQLVEVTAAQVEPLLAVLRQAGNWREVHPTDRVRIWLDDETLVPLDLAVYASPDAVRSEWAARLGYDDEPTRPIFELRLSDMAVDADPPSDAFPAPPGGAVTQTQGFADVPPGATGIGRPAGIPAGMASHRSGVVKTETGPLVAVRSWSDGRAWVTVRVTREWAGGRMFGSPGDPVRTVTLADGGAAYVGAGGGSVAVHGSDEDGAVDVLVTGTLTEDALLEIAAGLGISAEPVPSWWPEASVASIDDARAAVPGLLVPGTLAGFDAPGINVEKGLVELAFAGPGDRGFVVVEAPGTALAAPLERDAQGVALRDTTARFSPARGELEWVEDGVVVSLRSDALTLAELVTLAEHLEPAE